MKNFKKLILVATILMLMSFLFTGCYINDQVTPNQVGLRMGNGVSIDEVVGAGRYSDWGWFSNMTIVDASAKTIIWEDPDMWTADKQPVKFKVSVTYARKRDKDAVSKMWEMYNAEAKDDAALAQLVTSRIPRVAKQVTTGMTLDAMLGISENTATEVADDASKGREVLQSRLVDLLTPELDEFGVVLLDVGVNDIGVDEDYANKLKEKAISKVASELSEQKTKQLQDQVNQEKAQTDIDVEIAKRKNLVQEEENKIFVENPQAFELERLRLLENILGDSDKIYFIPQGADLSLYLSGNAVNPIPSSDK